MRSTPNAGWRGAALLLGAALAVYWGVWRFELVNFDDEIALSAAARPTPGAADADASFGRFLALFRYEKGREYLPVRDASYLIDEIIGGGVRPSVLHTTNFVLHAANGLLLGALASFLGLPPIGAFFASGLFLLHPMQVEAVAWVSGRKDLLAALFALLAWHAFARRRPGFSALFFLAAGLSKATVVFFPAVLLIARACGSRGAGAAATGAGEVAPGGGRGLRASLWEIAPHALVAAAIAALQIRTSSDAGMLRSPGEGGLLGSVLLAAKISLLYLRNVVWPADLHLLYAPALPSPAEPAAWLAPVAMVAIAALALRSARAFPLVPLGGAAFFLLLLPTLGLVPFRLLMADRYAYLPIVGLALAAGSLIAGARVADARRAEVGGSDAARDRGFAANRVRWAIALALLLPLALLARREVPAWRDSEALWKREIARGPRHAEAWANLGEHYLTRGRAAEAADALAQAAERRPDSVPILTNWALAASRAGRHAEALAAIDAAKKNALRDPQVRYNAACVRAAAGDIDGALEDLEQAILFGFTDRRTLETDPDLAPLRDDPRFTKMLAGLLANDGH